ncbi:unnamed protein product [Lathyrus sativus]|nr:unnamed protein product [Lathyrus sativus]
MDRSWMKADRLDPVYEKGVLEFVEYADQNVHDNNGIFYFPCANCGNINEGKKDEIFHHLCCDGICQNYTIWTWHDEVEKSETWRHKGDEDGYMDDPLEDMFYDIRESCFKKSHVYDIFYSDKDIPLYKGCTHFTRLSVVLKLFNLKAKNECSDKSFT